MYLTLLRELEKELLTEVGFSLWSKSGSDFKSKLENVSTRKPVLSTRPKLSEGMSEACERVVDRSICLSAWQKYLRRNDGSLGTRR